MIGLHKYINWQEHYLGYVYTYFWTITCHYLLTETLPLSCLCVCVLWWWRQDSKHLNSVLCQTFIFCYLWAVGGNLTSSHWDAFDTFVREQFEDNSDAKVCTQPQIHVEIDGQDRGFFLHCNHICSYHTGIKKIDTSHMSSVAVKFLSAIQGTFILHLCYWGSTHLPTRCWYRHEICEKACGLAHIRYYIKALLALDVSS